MPDVSGLVTISILATKIEKVENKITDRSIYITLLNLTNLLAQYFMKD